MLDDLAIGSIATASTRLYDSSQHVSVPYDPADGTMCVDFSGFPCWIDIECLDRAAIPDLHDPAALEAWLSESH